MGTKWSFLDEKTAPSERLASSRISSPKSRPACPGSRSWMKTAFSDIRVASRISGTPYSAVSARTARRLSSENGWPPAMFRQASWRTKAIRSRPSSCSTRSSATRSMLPLNG